MKYLNRKYRFFSKKLRDVQCSIWELEFKVAKTRQIREDVRTDRDRAVEAVQRLDAIITSDLPKEEKAKYEEQHKSASENAKRYERQMQMLDEQVYGVPVKGEDPGTPGIMDHIKSLVELKSMYEQYLETL